MHTPAPPWWKFGHVWLLIAGPVLVIIAGVVTAWLALSAPDPVLARDDARPSETPAQFARNHAQTGGVPGGE